MKTSYKITFQLLALSLPYHLVFGHGVRSHHHTENLLNRNLQNDGRCKYSPPSPAESAQIQKDLAGFLEKIGGEEVLRAARKNTVTINTYFHVFSKSDGSGDIDDSVIEKQMQILNDAFSGVESNYTECSGFTYESMAKSPFHFDLMETIRTVDDDAFELDSFASEQTRASLRKGSCSDLNIYSGGTSLLGFATLPISCSGSTEGDSVVINYKSVPEGGEANFDQGDTLVHEVGHWLGLEHTFHRGAQLCLFRSLFKQSNVCLNGENVGDFVLDTPAQDSETFGCPINRDSCPISEGLDPIHNFMDYSDDCCMYTFTEGQVDRMILQVWQYRNINI